MGFGAVAAFQLVNLKAWLFCAAAVGTFFRVGAGSAFGQAAFLAVLFILAALPGLFVWLAAGANVQRCLRTDRASRIFTVSMGVLLAGSVLLCIW